jgi:hypothetical protein
MTTRVRRVFPRETVAHLWAHGAQDGARDSSRNFYFTGPTLYSYGSHFVMGHILKGEQYGPLNGCILWNDESRSNTTSKHQSIAWRSMTRQQRDNAIHLPEIDQDIARSIDRAIVNKQLPDFAAKLVRVVQSHIVAILGKRHNSGPFCDSVFNARKYDKSARALYSAAKKKYPLPEIPADIPAEKNARVQFVASFSRAIVLENLATARREAADYLRVAQSESTSLTGDAYTDPRSHARIMASTYDCAVRGLDACDDADKHYATLHTGKKRDPQASKIRKALEPLASAFKMAREKADIEVGKNEVNRFIQSYFKYCRGRHHSANQRELFPIPGYIPKPSRNYLASLPADSFENAIVNRAKRIQTVSEINRLYKHILSDLAAAESYGDQYPHYALRCFNTVAATALSIERMNHGYSLFILTRIEPLLRDARVKITHYQKIIQEKNAKVISDWIAGVSNVRPPYEAGTYARIKGANVETNRGATVPIEHACRLTRVFDRIVSAGGKQWSDGAGPIVGHYRVNSIGADGSLVIGCHEFTPVEAKRMRDILANCQECADVLAGESANV